MEIKDKLIVGIAGKMGSGKDTLASKLIGFKVMRFADALKEAACLIFGWRREMLEDLCFKMSVDLFWGEAPRALLQRLGTEAMRHGIRRDVWIKVLERRILNESSRRIAVTDVRFLNEAQAICDWGGYMVKVERPEFAVPNATAAHTQHASEVEMDGYTDWFAKVVNYRGLAELEADGRRLSRQLEDTYVDRATKTSG